MKITESIIQTALLGTFDHKFVPDDFPKSLQSLVDRIREKSEDTESFIYMTAASAFAYARAGYEAVEAEGFFPLQTAPDEKLPYFDKDRSRLFSRLQDTRHMLVYAYRKAQDSGKIISPEYLQPLLRRAYDRGNPSRLEERRMLKTLAGNRGAWLIRHMGIVTEEDEESNSWDTAPHAERRAILSMFRLKDPAAALNVLRKDWKGEPANHRNELLVCLRTNIGKSDESFLQEVMESDRSSVVRETACKLLGMIPDSEMVTECCRLLRGHIRYNRFTGWSYNAMAYTPEMKSMGLSEVSPNKKESDSEFILRQLSERVPLSFWSEVFGCECEKAARKFVRHPPFKKFMIVENPILNFSDRLWAFHTLKEDPSYLRIPQLVGLLVPSQREEICWPDKVTNFDHIPDSWYDNDFETWGPKFSSSVLSWLLRQDFLYSAAQMAEQLALHIPSGLRSVIKTKAATSDTATPSMIEFCSKMLEFMDLKSEIDTLFNDNNI